MARAPFARALLVGVSILAIVLLWLHGPIAQDPAYHRFADSRRIADVPNFWNVVSNLPFALVGLYGLLRIPRLAVADTRPGYVVLCLGVCAVAFGSGYYHLHPDNATLVWDRLPMAVAFMALLSLLLDESVFERARPGVLAALVLAGVGSVAYWAVGDAQGVGDLRPYVLVQFLPMLLVPLILLLFARRYLATRWLLASLVGYVLAKLLEYFDAAIYSASGVMSGHALKHVVAALAVGCILRAVPIRGDQPVSQSRGRR